MTRADDLRAAARWIDDSCGERTEIGDGLRQHADTIAAQESELSRLRAEVEKYRGGMHTHGPDCWSWGWRHYECAEREIARLRARVAELEAGEPVLWVHPMMLETPMLAVECSFVRLADAQVPLFLGPQRMTEAQAREAFDKWARAYDPRWKLDTDWTAYAAAIVWLAALRHLGAIKDPT